MIASGPMNESQKDPELRIRAFEVTRDPALNPIPPTIEACKAARKERAVWLDIQGDDSAQLEEWLTELGVGKLTRKLCHTARDRAGFYPIKQELFMVISVATDAEQTAISDHLTMVCTERLLLTIHHFPHQPLEQPAERQEVESLLSTDDIASLVSALLIRLSLNTLSLAANVRERIIALEERMDHDVDSVDSDEIRDLKSAVLAISSVVSDQLPAVQAMSVTNKPFFSLEETHEHMNCVVVNFKAVISSLSWFDQRINTLQTAFDTNTREKTNRRLNALTVLSAVFMPITLLAGVWGMNFAHMPELDLPHAYPAAIGIMLMIGVGMYLFFRRAGWLE